jgi:hypothetical protein
MLAVAFDLLHTPPVVVFDRVVVLPTQTLVVPVIAAITGRAITVSILVTVVVHPELVTAYDIVDVPADTPVTRPPDIVAAPVLEELHTPPAVASDSVVVLPAHSCVVPEIAATTGRGLTVTELLAVAVHPPVPVTVTVYVPLAVAVIEDVVADPPVAFHTYEVPPDAVSVPDPQKVLGPTGLIAADGAGLTVTT